MDNAKPQLVIGMRYRNATTEGIWIYWTDDGVYVRLQCTLDGFQARSSMKVASLRLAVENRVMVPMVAAPGDSQPFCDQAEVSSPSF